MPRTTATTDCARQLRLLRKGRDRWRQRCAAKQDEIRYLRVKVRDLQASRAQWKRDAHQQRAALDRLPTTPCTAEHHLGEAPARRSC